MAEAVVVLAPDMGTEEVVQRGDRPAPRDFIAHLQPLGVLVEHRIDDVDEGFVAGEEAVPAGQQIPFQPALALVLAEHLHHAAVRREVVVLRIDVGHVAAVGNLQHVLPAIGVVFIRTEEAEVLAFQIELHHVAKKLAHRARGLGRGCTRARHVDRIVPEVGHPEIPQEQSAIRMRIVAHPALAFGGERSQFGVQPPIGVEQLFRPVALHPLFENPDVLGLIHVAHGNLMRTPVVLAFLAVDFRRAGPALRRAKDDHRPGRAFQIAFVCERRPRSA